MSLRIAFDLDGVLADMEAALARESHVLFPMRSSQPSGELTVFSRTHEVPATGGSQFGGVTRGANVFTPYAEKGVHAEESERSELTTSVQATELTRAQQRRLWSEVTSRENFWEGLDETEPGCVARLADVVAERRWEVIFLTQRPFTAGRTVQVQSQRWLEQHGFTLPSVFVVTGSRGRIADALALDAVVDDRRDNCVDVLSDSQAHPILVLREQDRPVAASAKRLGIQVVISVREGMEALAALDNDIRTPKNLKHTVKRWLGIEST